MNNIFKLLWVSVFLVMSCAPQSAVVMSGGIPAKGVPQTQPAQAVTLAKREPYTGPISIKIDTGLLNKNNSQRRVVTVSTPVQTFKTEAVPTGPVVFQETFVRAQGQDVTMRTFVVSDPSKFYTVHVQNGDAQGNNETTSAVVNINGFDWVRANEIKKQIPEVQKDSVLLQANNVLTVTHHGSPGSTFTLTVIEGGQAGTIRRRNGPLNDHPTQGDHVKGLDKNIFDPTDSSSLGGLQPAEGDTVLGSGLQMSQFMLTEPDRDTLPIDFEAGILTVEFQNPTTDLVTFQQLYGSTVREMIDIDGRQFYDMKLDLTRSPVLQAESLLRAFNVTFNRSISEVFLSSMTAFKTLVLELDMLVNHGDIIKSVSVNGVASPTLASSEAVVVDVSNDVAFDDNFLLHGASSVTNTYGKSWWLNDTRVRQAWNYSLGTGTTVAWIDTGYFTGNTNAEIHPELEKRTPERIYFSGQNNNQTANRSTTSPTGIKGDIRNPANEYLSTTKDHGIHTVQAGFGERNNNRGGAGVAPNANVVLYHTGESTTSNVTSAIWAALALTSPKVNVIGINVAWLANDSLAGYDKVVAAINSAVGNHTGTSNNKAVIVPASNYGISVREANDIANIVPAGSKSLQNQLIVAAGVMGNFNSSKGALRAVHPSTRVVAGDPVSGGTFGLIAWDDPSKPLRDKERGTGFNGIDPTNVFWMPSDRILYSDAQNPATALVVPGTSMACPQLTGIVALMKSRNPNLTPVEIKNKLRANSHLPVLQSVEMTKYPATNSYPARLVDAFGAVVSAVDALESTYNTETTPTGAQTIPDNFKKKYEAQPFLGVIDTSSGKSIKLNMDVGGSSSPNDRIKTLIQSVNNNQWGRLINNSVFKIIGWSDNGSIGADKLEILDIQLVGTPSIRSIQFIQPNNRKVNESVTNIDKKKDLTVIVKGTDMMADIAKSKPLQLAFNGILIPMNFSLGSTLNNAGTEATFVVPAGTLNALTTGTYSLQVIGVGGPITIGSTSSSSYSFKVASTDIHPGAGTNIGGNSVSVIITDGSPTADVNENEIVAFKTNGTPLEDEPDKSTFRVKLDNQTTLVNGMEIPIIAVVDDMLLFGIPNGMPEGLYRLLIQTGGGKGMSIVDAIRVLGRPPVNNPTTPSFTTWSARVFNVSDHTRIIIDDNAILAEGFPGTDASFSITANIIGLHKLRFEAYNLDNTNGTSWGFEVKANGKLVYRDVRGNNQNRLNANELLILPFMAMLDGGDDLQTGLVFAQNMYVKQNQASFGSLNSYTAKLFNVSDTMDILVNNTSLIEIHDDGSGQAQNSASFNHLMQFGKGNEVRFRARKGPHDKQFTGMNFTYGMEVKYGSQIIYHYVDGQRNAVNTLSAGAKWHEEALIGQPLLDEKFLVFQ